MASPNPLPRFLSSLRRRLPVPVGPRPMALRYPRLFYGRPEGRLEVLRRVATQVVREERVELPLHRAFEARPYVERLLQLAIENGPRDEYTMQMCQWWLMENDLIHKLFKVLVPRYGKDYLEATDGAEPLTSLWRLPTRLTIRPRRFRAVPQEFWSWQNYAVLELKGNPFPPVVPQPADHRHTLLNVLVAAARRRHQFDAGDGRDDNKGDRDPSFAWAEKLGFL